MTAFSQRCDALPRLGIGRVHGIWRIYAQRRARYRPSGEDYPTYAQFLEVGVETGLDDDAQAWVESGRPATYHSGFKSR